MPDAFSSASTHRRGADALFAFIEHGLDSRRSYLTVLYYCTIVLIQYEEEMTPDDVAVGVLRA
jgi:hypothetical protein